jgi:hypothetical protein
MNYAELLSLASKSSQEALLCILGNTYLTSVGDNAVLHFEQLELTTL